MTLLDANQVAEMLGVERTWVLRAAREGKMPAIHLGRHVRFRRESVEEWLKEVEEGKVTVTMARSKIT